MSTRRGGSWQALAAGLLVTASCATSDDVYGSGQRTESRREVTPQAFEVTTNVQRPISRFIYGVNFGELDGTPSGTAPWYGAVLPRGITLTRFGGNRLSAFDWVTGYSNVGTDGGHWENDRYLASSGNGAWNYGTAPGAAVAGRMDAARLRGRALMLTIPMLGYVAASGTGVPLDTALATWPARLAAYFKPSLPRKGSPFVVPTGAEPVVYQDELVAFVRDRVARVPADSSTPVFFGLDNEPDLWGSTHPEVTRPMWSYAEFSETSIAYAAAIKDVMPNAKVFGPSVATYTGMVAGDRYRNGWTDDPMYARHNFLSIYLDRMSAANRSRGRRLLDVLDVHFYPSAGTSRGEVGNDRAPQDSAMIAARLQAPRSLWDPTFVEGSWVNDVAGGAIRLLPWLRDLVQHHYPGTPLSISEYYYGRGGDISGGLAQADVLGIFGREGVFAAALWPNAAVDATPYGGEGAKAYAYLFAAFRLFLDYDGKGTGFGSVSVRATASDPGRASVYASLGPAGRVTIIAINKDQGHEQSVSLNVRHPTALPHLSAAYELTGDSPEIVKLLEPSVRFLGFAGGVNRYGVRLPALSATVLAFTP